VDGPGPRPPAWEVTRTEPRAAYSVFRTRRDHVRSPVDGSRYAFDIVESAEAVTVVPITPDGRLVLIQQFRHGTRRVTLEFPGGILDPGETVVECARRELREETGWTGGVAERIGTLEMNPGWQTARLHIVRLVGIEPDGPGTHGPDEDILVRTISRGELLRMLQDGSFDSAGSVAALALHLWREPSP
jgi:ADP-ribose pyrophosphatase